MLNQLYSLLNNLSDFGINPKDLAGSGGIMHTNIHTQPPGGIGYICTVDKDGLPIALTENPDFGNLWYVNLNKHNNGLTFKFEPGKTNKKLLGSVGRNLDFTASLIKYCDKKQQSLAQLCEAISRVDHQEFIDKIKFFIKKNDITVPIFYLCLELPDDSIQVAKTFRKLSESMTNAVESPSAPIKSWDQNTDFFGGSLAGWDKPFSDAKAVHVTSLFAKNVYNGCYTRFGITSLESCPVGTEIRSRIENVYKVLFTKDNKNRIWKMITQKYGAKSKINYLVISNLDPGSRIIESDYLENAPGPAEWIALCESYITALQGRLVERPDNRAIVLVLRKPDNGQWNVASFINRGGDEWITAAQKWTTAINNYPHTHAKFISIIYPSLYKAVSVLNASWEINREEKKSKIALSPVNTIRIKTNEVYDLFFGNEKAAQHFLSVLVQNHLPMMLKFVTEELELDNRKGTNAFNFRYLFSISGMILSYYGHTKETIMNSWPYLLGKLLNEANEIHKTIFIVRNMNVPSDLVGHRYNHQILINPASGFAKFVTNFRNYYQSMESIHDVSNEHRSKGAWGNLFQYRKLLSELAELRPEFPNTMNDQEKIQFMMGFAHVKPKFEKTTEKNQESTVIKEKDAV